MWSSAMVTWFERMTKCVHAEGDYFEKNGLGKKYVRVPRPPHPETYGGTLVLGQWNSRTISFLTKTKVLQKTGGFHPSCIDVKLGS